jgi:hypothetical protein
MIVVRSLSRDDLLSAVKISLAYSWRYFAVGFLAAALTSGIVHILLGMIHNVVAALIVFPGSVLIQLVARKFSTAGSWVMEPDRMWRPAILSIALTWIGYLLIASIPIMPAAILMTLFGAASAWVLHLGGWVILASTIGQGIAAWQKPSSEVQFRPPGRY